jgi:phage tail sheath protein FI
MFVTSESSVSRHGAFALEREPPATIRAIGTGVVAIVGQFPWGPDGADGTKPHQATDTADRLLTFAPPGMTRTGDGYLSLIRKAWADLRVVRVMGSEAAKASAALLDGADTVVTVQALYKGAAGNDIDCIVTNADDGDANHFNLEVVVTGASGTTRDVFKNLNYSGTGADSTPVLTQCRLVGAFTAGTDGRPTNGTYSMTTGADGTVDGAAYIGTAGAGNQGIALCENDREIRCVFADDVGTTARAAVNAGLLAHATLMGDRMVVINGDSGNTLAEAQTDRESYSSDRAIYADPWPRVYDDVDGTLRLASPASFVASVFSQVSPSTSVAWKHPRVIAMLGGIAELETPRGNGAGSNSNVGIATFVQEENGGYAIEAGVTTVTAADPARRNITRRRIGDYIAISFTRSVRSLVDAPNVAANWALLTAPLKSLMETLKQNAVTDPNNLPHVVDYTIPDLAAFNTTASLAAGNFFLPLDVQTSSAMEQIFLTIRFGEGVTVSAS